PFKPVFNLFIVEMMHFLLWDYSSEYLFLVAENIDFIDKLYKEVKNKEGFDIKNMHVKICNIFYQMDEKLARVVYYDLEKYKSKPRGQIPKISYHDYVILAIPQVPATQIISSFGSTTVYIYNEEVKIPSIGLKKIYNNDDDDKGILLPLMLSFKNEKEAANAHYSYSHLEGWLEGAFISAINAVLEIIVAANNSNINALNTEAKKLFQDLESVVSPIV
ncbi:28766_t:CDS:2, partial [Gigaspora margarita]